MEKRREGGRERREGGRKGGRGIGRTERRREGEEGGRKEGRGERRDWTDGEKEGRDWMDGEKEGGRGRREGMKGLDDGEKEGGREGMKGLDRQRKGGREGGKERSKDYLLSPQVALKLTKSELVKKVERQKPLLDVVVREMRADVVDRKWDTQGSVSIKAMEVLDYITLGQ